MLVERIFYRRNYQGHNKARKHAFIGVAFGLLVSFVLSLKSIGWMSYYCTNRMSLNVPMYIIHFERFLIAVEVSVQK
jgi:hypothetical protein